MEEKLTMAYLKADKFRTDNSGAAGFAYPEADIFNPQQTDSGHFPMTVNGVIMRTFFLLMITAIAGAAGWVFLAPRPELFLIAAAIGAGGALLFGFLAGRKPLNAKVPAILYAAAQGFLIGGISGYMAQSYYADIVVQALVLTAVIVGVTLALYATGLFRLSKKGQTIVAVLTLSIMAYYLVAIGAGLIFGYSVPLIWDSGLIGIGFSVFVLIVATLNLFTNYAVITEAIESKADERFEWYAAFGITATVLWIYIEILRLLSKVQNN